MFSPAKAQWNRVLRRRVRSKRDLCSLLGLPNRTHAALTRAHLLPRRGSGLLAPELQGADGQNDQGRYEEQPDVQDLAREAGDEDQHSGEAVRTGRIAPSAEPGLGVVEGRQAWLPRPDLQAVARLLHQR